MSLKKLTGLAIVASILAAIVGFNAYAKTNIYAAIMALQEDLHYSEEEAINVVDEVIKEAKSV